MATFSEMATAEANDGQVPAIARAKPKLCVLSREENQPCQKVMSKTCVREAASWALPEREIVCLFFKQ